MNINVVKLSASGNDLSWFVTCVSVPLVTGCLSANQGFFASSFLFQHFLGTHQHGTGYLLVLGSWRIQGTYQSMHSLDASREVWTCRSTWPSQYFLFLLKIDKISRGNTLSALGSQRILEKLDSIMCCQRFSVKQSRVHFRISDKSALQRWSSFAYFEHCKIQPIINLLLVLEPRSETLTSGGIFVVILVAAAHWSDDSARYAPTTDSAFSLEFSAERNGKSSRSSLILLNFERYSSQ